MEKPEGYPEVFEEDQTMASSANPTGESSWLWPGPQNDMSFEMAQDHEYYYSFGHQSKFRRVSNPKLLALVEFLRELFLRRKELLPRLQHQLHDSAKKSGFRLWRVKSDNRTRVVTVNRSLSFGSSNGSKYGDEWIKIKTINIDSGGNPQGGSGGGQVGGRGGSE